METLRKPYLVRRRRRSDSRSSWTTLCFSRLGAGTDCTVLYLSTLLCLHCRGCTPDEYTTKLSLIEGLKAMQGEVPTTSKAKRLVDSAKLDKSKGEQVRLEAMRTQAKRKCMKLSEMKFSVNFCISTYICTYLFFNYSPGF